MFGKKKQKREGALEDDKAQELIKTLNVNDSVTVERINWDNTLSTVSGRVTHVSADFDKFSIVEEGTGEAIDFSIEAGDISRIERMAISIDLDENQQESYMDVDKIVELLEALDHGDVVSVSYYDVYKGRGIALTGAINLKDEYNKIFSIEYDDNGEKKEKHFDLNEDRIIDIIIQ